VAEVPPVVVVAVTLMVPAVPRGAVALIEVADTKVTVDAAVAPNFTVVAPETKPVPVRVTTVPAARGPLDGLRAVTVGAARYVYWFAVALADVPADVVTVTLTIPAVPAGAVALIDVAETNVTAVPALAPNLTVVVPLTKPVPVRVTTVPPARGPFAGLSAVTVGPATYVKLTTLVDVPPGVVTFTVTAPVPAGAVAVIWVEELTVTVDAEFAPNFTPVAPVKFVPVMVTTVPPAAGPLVGLSDVTVGAAT